jgi:hypothetical protein
LSVTAQKGQEKLLAYYKNNIDRMQYKLFRNQGLMVGSGPMEAAQNRNTDKNETKRAALDARGGAGDAQLTGYKAKRSMELRNRLTAECRVELKWVHFKTSFFELYIKKVL